MVSGTGIPLKPQSSGIYKRNKKSSRSGTPNSMINSNGRQKSNPRNAKNEGLSKNRGYTGKSQSKPNIEQMTTDNSGTRLDLN